MCYLRKLDTKNRENASMTVATNPGCAGSYDRAIDMNFARHIFETVLVRPFLMLLYGFGLTGACAALLTELVTLVRNNPSWL
jgi:hypothetical protein